MNRKDIPYTIAETLILWIIGGLVYLLIELLYRGRTHWTMGIVGGLCFVLIGLINERHTKEKYLAIESQAVLGAAVVTLVELLSGIVINRILGWNVWDYSNIPHNVLGQICLPFTIAWIFVAEAAIVLDDFLRHVLFMEPFPTYWFLFSGRTINVFSLWEKHVCKNRHKPN